VTLSQPKVLLAIPGYRMQFCAAAGAADRVIAEAIQVGVLAEVTRPIGMNIHQARNAVFYDAARSQGITHVFFLDDDVVPPPGALLKLLSRQAGIIGGCYPLRIDKQIKAAAWDWNSQGSAELYDWSHYEGRLAVRGHLAAGGNLDVITVGGVGTGCMLISIDVIRTVLEKWPTPFQSPDEVGPHGGLVNVSDDVYFANRLRDMGIPVLLDKTVLCKHFGVVDFGEMPRGDDR